MRVLPEDKPNDVPMYIWCYREAQAAEHGQEVKTPRDLGRRRLRQLFLLRIKMEALSWLCGTVVLSYDSK